MLVEQAARRPEGTDADAITNFADPRAQTIRPRWAGEPFDLHACVEALLTMRLPQDRPEAA